jgi:hypothetical protein
MIGKNVSNGWKITAEGPGVGKGFRDVFGNKWNNGANESGGGLGRSVNYDCFRQWGASLKKHENRCADIEKRERGGWGAGEKKVNAALTCKREKGLA